ncbi:alpha/beta fold hydrolase [Actinomycetospora callitridis]|uniref:alpha/beta fold hydrolase n=1 Tax=Actinomycetospora callitridis TaxID=913944 RepID=UPI0023658E7F|nr:hypothetical protein [Actinomycetospora callitridis]MDD7916990.1 hypothetical protein [Actinomycetospora callitridis]
MNVTVDGRTVALAEHGDPDGHLDWSAVPTPVEIFQGEEDAWVPMDHAEDIASRLPAGIARIHRLPGVGHLSIQDHVVEVLDALVTP